MQRLEILFYTASIFKLGVSQHPMYHLVTSFVQWSCLPQSSTTVSQSSDNLKMKPLQYK